jgi:AbiV family abortive infection protein
LVHAAKILFDKNFIDLASFFLCTAIEEIGKAYLLMDFQEGKFKGDLQASNKLNKSFFKHLEKIEDSLSRVRIDDLLFEKIIESKFDSNEDVEEIIEKFKTIIEDLPSPNVKIQAKKTFKKRNNLLYTDFDKQKFFSPKSRGRKSTYANLLDIAEKAIAGADVDLFLGEFCFARGGSRSQLAEAINNIFPDIVNGLYSKLSESKRRK